MGIDRDDRGMQRKRRYSIVAVVLAASIIAIGPIAVANNAAHRRSAFSWSVRFAGLWGGTRRIGFLSSVGPGTDDKTWTGANEFQQPLVRDSRELNVEILQLRHTLERFDRRIRNGRVFQDAVFQRIYLGKSANACVGDLRALERDENN